MSVWNSENIRDVASAVGITNLGDEATRTLTADVEYRIAQILEEALKFMRHGKRTSLTTQDISKAARVLGVEPLYGYESTRPLRFGEATIGPGQPLYYVEDEETELEKLINTPLPPVPREISFTAHWLAVEGVQPSIPQNPTAAESRNQELVPKGGIASASLAAMNGSGADGVSGSTITGDNVAIKPLVKHVLSKELQQYFHQVSGAVLDQANDDYRTAALASLSGDPGLHQLVPYFVQFIAEKVTHGLKDLFVLTQMMEVTHALLNNQHLFLDPYVASLVPSILTCLLTRKLGPPSTSTSTTSPPTFPLRRLAASLLKVISRRYAKSSQTLKPRLARTCLKSFLDPTKSLATHYGAILGLQAVGSVEVTRALIVPNLKEYETVLREGGLDSMDEGKKAEAEMVQNLLVDAVQSLEGEATGKKIVLKRKSEAGESENGDVMDDGPIEMSAEEKVALEDKIGSLFTEKVVQMRRPKIALAVMECFD